MADSTASGRVRHRWQWLLVLTPLLLFTCCFPWRMFSWTETVISLPDGSGRIVFGQKGAHPFLAEYFYRVRIETSKHQGVTVGLPTNSGGRTSMGVWWHPAKDGYGPFVRLKDHNGDYIVDLAQAKSYEVYWANNTPYGGDVTDLGQDGHGAYVSWLVTGDTKVYNEGGELIETHKGGEVSFGGQPAQNLTGIIDFGAGTYLGHIDPRGRLRKGER